jgi:hypothetical protein
MNPAGNGVIKRLRHRQDRTLHPAPCTHGAPTQAPSERGDNGMGCWRFAFHVSVSWGVLVLGMGIINY